MALKPVTLAPISVTSGTPIQLPAAPSHCLGVLLQAPAGNTGKVYVGDSSVSKTTPRGYELSPGQSFGVEGFDSYGSQSLMLQDFWVDGTVTNDRVLVTYITRLK
jgi:hypothetical protein